MPVARNSWNAFWTLGCQKLKNIDKKSFAISNVSLFKLSIIADQNKLVFCPLVVRQYHCECHRQSCLIID